MEKPESSFGTAPGFPAGGQVLLVEDDGGLSGRLCDSLAAAGFACACVPSGQEALVLIRAGGIRVVLFDYRLSDMPIRAAVARTAGRLPHLLVFNGPGEESVAAGIMALGAWDYLAAGALLVHRLVQAVRRAHEAISMREKLDQAERGRREVETRHLFLERNIADLVWVLDVGRMTFDYVSPSARQLLGFAPEELRGAAVEPLLATPMGRQAFAELLAQATRHPPVAVPRTREVELRRKNGSTVWTETTASPTGGGGAGIKLIGVTRDITMRRDAEKTRDESRACFWKLLEAAPDAVLFLSQGQINYLNFAAGQMLGAETPEQLLGHPVLTRVHADYRVQVGQRLDLQSRGQRVPPMEIACLRLDGTSVSVEITSTPFVHQGCAGVIVFARDITERRRTTEQLLSRERLLNSIHRASPAGMGLVVARRFVEVNPKLCRMTGYEAEELLGQSTEILYLSDEEFERIGDRLRGRGGVSEQGLIESQWRTKDGRIIDVLLNSAPLESYAASDAGIFTVLDITQRCRAERELARNEAELEAIHDNAPLMLLLVDRNGHIRRLNRAAREFIGDAAGSGEPISVRDVLGCPSTPARVGTASGPSDVQPVWERILTDTLATGAAYRRVEVELTRRSHREKQAVALLVSVARVTADGDPLALFCLEDVTERKQLEEQFRQTQRFEAIGQLAGGVAHDFNNILAALLLHLGLLKDDPRLSPSLKDEFKELSDAARRGTNLTRQLLLFSQSRVPQVAPFDLVALLAELLKMLRRLLGEHIECLFAGGDGAIWIEADSGMIEQVIMNLCLNARDAMPEGGKLTLRTGIQELSSRALPAQSKARPGRYARLSVSDTGCGMDEVVLKRIFEPFFTTKSPGQGTGLGLPTAQRIVEQHRGWIEVSSTLGVGSTFDVFLPADDKVRRASSGLATAAMPRGKETLLVVEDDETIRRIIRLGLNHLGYTVLTAESGEEALKHWRLRRDKIALVFSDMRLPGAVSGLELARRFRADRPSLPFVMSSGYSGELRGQEEAVGLAFLPKPFELPALASAIRNCIDHRTQ